MKKFAIGIIILLISISVFLLGFNYKDSEEPNNFYQVYLDQEIIGVIKSKIALEKYIDQRGNYIKMKYNTKEVYAPNGLEIKKITTYVNHTDDVKKVYELIEQKRPFTIKGYQFTITTETSTKKFFVTATSVYDDAIIHTFNTFVGTDNYNVFKSNDQKPIKTTGRIIEDVYIDGNQTIKEMNIPVTETIYTDSKELSKILLFGTTNQQKKYVVKSGDTIDQVAFNNEISVEEFLISNPTFTNSKNLLFPGQEVTIGVTDPQIQVVEKEHVVEDIVSKYGIDYIVDPSLYVGERKVERVGENGLIRVAQKVTSVNGMITIVSDPESKEELKASINQLVRVGDKQLPNYVGSTDSWGWPTNAGWTITSDYGYRINPINGVRELHQAIDIAGTGYRSNIYAANAGTVLKAGYHSQFGNYITIDHNNGYYTLYAHLDKMIVSAGQIVERGQIIGYMGHTGWATGTHLHFSIYNSIPLSGPRALNPWNFYR